MSKRRRYSDEFRAGAVLMLEAAGYPGKKDALAEVSKSQHVPSATLHRWFHEKNNPPPSELVTKKRPELAEMFRDEIYAIFSEMPAARKDAGYRDLGTVLGILADKLQLLTGQPTERLALVQEETTLADEFERLVNRAAASLAAGSENGGTE